MYYKLRWTLVMTPDMWYWARGHLSLQRWSQGWKLRSDLALETPLWERNIPLLPVGLVKLKKISREMEKSYRSVKVKRYFQSLVSLSFKQTGQHRHHTIKAWPCARRCEFQHLSWTVCKRRRLILHGCVQLTCIAVWLIVEADRDGGWRGTPAMVTAVTISPDVFPTSLWTSNWYWKRVNL